MANLERIYMKQPTTIVRVRFKSALPREQLMKLAEERVPEFEALSGLRQKYYLHNPETGDYAGLYIWDSPEAFAEYRRSALSASIANVYQTQGAPQIEVYEIIKVLRKDRP